MKYRCSCGHHKVVMVIGVLSWLAAIGFFWAEFGATLVLSYDSSFYLSAFLIVALLGMGMNKSCNCCCGAPHCRECRVEGSK